MILYVSANLFPISEMMMLKNLRIQLNEEDLEDYDNDDEVDKEIDFLYKKKKLYQI